MTIDFQRLFESAPNLYLVLSPDLTIVGASEAYVSATLTKREEIMGRNLFDVFPDNPDDPTADGVSNLRASLDSAFKNKAPHTMATQKYDIRRPDGSFEVRYWSPLNTPIMDDNNEVIYFIHRVEDVTELVLAKKATEEAQKVHRQQLKESENRFMQIFNLCPIAIYMTNIEDGKFMHVNKAFEDLFLYKREDVIGKTAVELMLTDEEKRAETVQYIKQHGGRIYEYELELRIANGKTKNMLMSTEIIDIDGKKCFLIAMMDISKRKEMESELKNTNHFLDTILENIPDMVFVKDAKELRFMRFNKAGERILGYNKQDLIGKNDYDFFPQEQADFFTSNDRHVFSGKELVDIEEEPIQATYGQRWLYTKKIPVFENGKPVYLIGISEDITERKKQRDAILKLNKELEAFTYSVSHDLRAPLRAVTGYARIMEEDYGKILDAEGSRLLNTISSNAEKMGRLIDDLLNFSRLGRKDLLKTDTNMNLLVENSLREIGRASTYRAETRISNLPTVQVDPVLMHQVMMNLLGNAIKYSSKKEDPVIEISSRQADDHYEFSIKDNGAGFDSRYAGKLFGVFQRLHSNEEFEGTGVGLAIVQSIIEKHGGKVWGEGKINEGATFYFTIPFNE